MKQISIQITDETARQIAALAEKWGLPDQRHNTPVIERAIERVYTQEFPRPPDEENTFHTV